MFCLRIDRRFSGHQSAENTMCRNTVGQPHDFSITFARGAREDGQFSTTSIDLLGQLFLEFDASFFAELNFSSNKVSGPCPQARLKGGTSVHRPSVPSVTGRQVCGLRICSKVLLTFPSGVHHQPHCGPLRVFQPLLFVPVDNSALFFPPTQFI